MFQTVMGKIRSLLKKIWTSFSDSPVVIFVAVPFFFIVFILFVVLWLVHKILEMLGIMSVAAFGKVNFEIVKKSPEWVGKFFDSIGIYFEAGYGKVPHSYPYIIHSGYSDGSDGTIINIEFDPTITNIDEIQKAIEQDGLELKIRDSKIRYAHRRFLFWKFGVRP